MIITEYMVLPTVLDTELYLGIYTVQEIYSQITLLQRRESFDLN